jgi:hypothetical protein
MTSAELRQKINSLRPSYHSDRKPLMELLSKKGGTKGEYTQFGPFYQTYMYAFFVGYQLGQRTPITGKKDNFFVLGEWKPKSIVDFILMLLVTNLEEFKDWNILENLEEEAINEKVDRLLIAMEEYANAGLIFLQDKYDNEKYEFQDPFVFVNFLNELTKEKKYQVLEA